MNNEKPYRFKSKLNYDDWSFMIYLLAKNLGKVFKYQEECVNGEQVSQDILDDKILDHSVLDNIHDRLPQDTQLQKDVEELSLNLLEENFTKNVSLKNIASALSCLHKPAMVKLLENLDKDPTMFDDYIEIYPEIKFDEFVKKTKTIK